MSAEEEAKEEARLSHSERVARLSCRVYVDALFHCYSPSNQLSTYYRTALVDDCVLPMERIKTCFKLQMSSEPDKQAALFVKLVGAGENSPSHEVWRTRPDPAEAWSTPPSTTTTGDAARASEGGGGRRP